MSKNPMENDEHCWECGFLLQVSETDTAIFKYCVNCQRMDVQKAGHKIDVTREIPEKCE